MIAKAATISHGGNAVRYSVNKDKAELVKVNFLPEDISAEAMYQRMVLKQKEFASTINKGRPLKRNVIRMELSQPKGNPQGGRWTIGQGWQTSTSKFSILLTCRKRLNVPVLSPLT